MNPRLWSGDACSDALFQPYACVYLICLPIHLSDSRTRYKTGLFRVWKKGCIVMWLTVLWGNGVFSGSRVSVVSNFGFFCFTLLSAGFTGVHQPPCQRLNLQIHNYSWDWMELQGSVLKAQGLIVSTGGKAVPPVCYKIIHAITCLIKPWIRGQRNGSVVKSVYYFSRGPEFSSHYLHWTAHRLVTPPPGHQTPLSSGQVYTNTSF